MTNLAHAVEIATQAHSGQTDKTGQPYFEHCRRVSNVVDTLDGKIVAYLHDVVEKGGWNLKALEDAGFSPEIVAAVDALTRRDDEDDRAFVRRAASNRLARAVKQADLLDNRRQAVAVGLPTARYEEALAILGRVFEQGKTDDAA